MKLGVRDEIQIEGHMHDGSGEDKEGSKREKCGLELAELREA